MRTVCVSTASFTFQQLLTAWNPIRPIAAALLTSSAWDLASKQGMVPWNGSRSHPAGQPHPQSADKNSWLGWDSTTNKSAVTSCSSGLNSVYSASSQLLTDTHAHISSVPALITMKLAHPVVRWQFIPVPPCRWLVLNCSLGLLSKVTMFCDIMLTDKSIYQVIAIGL